MQKLRSIALASIVLAGQIILVLNNQPLIGQSLSKPDSTSVDRKIPRFDIEMLYSYLGIDSAVTTKYPYAVKKSFTPIPLGAILGSSYYFNRHWGATFEYSNHPDGENDGLQAIQAGVIYRFPHKNWTPFLHALGGGTRMGGPNYPSHTQGIMSIYHDYTWGPAASGGGGLDYKPFWLHHHLGIRVFQVDYEYLNVDYPYDRGQLSGGDTNASTYRISSGIYIPFGSLKTSLHQ